MLGTTPIKLPLLRDTTGTPGLRGSLRRGAWEGNVSRGEVLQLSAQNLGRVVSEFLDDESVANSCEAATDRYGRVTRPVPKPCPKHQAGSGRTTSTSAIPASG